MSLVRVYTTPFTHSLWGGAVVVHRSHATICAEKNHGRPGKGVGDVTMHRLHAIPPAWRVSPPVCACKREAPLSLDLLHYAKSHPQLSHFHFYMQGGPRRHTVPPLDPYYPPPTCTQPILPSTSWGAGGTANLTGPWPSVSAPLPLPGPRRHSPHAPTL
ncbi:hypothetical protein EI94DRAFT_1764517 [Lactarius quietus]|nr:hypothetical protein EI94DRAFT_1764517 [Lactarius quietus]